MADGPKFGILKSLYVLRRGLFDILQIWFVGALLFYGGRAVIEIHLS